MSRIFLFKLTKRDFEVQPFIDSGKGGQKRNKTMSCCRIKHPASGAVAEATEERSFFQNKKVAFKRLLEKEIFKKWHKIQVSKFLGNYIDADKWADEQMNIYNLRFEIQVEGKWKVIKNQDIKDYDSLED